MFAVLFALLIVLLFHLIKQYSKPPPPPPSQPIPKFELREIGPSVGSSRYFYPKSPYLRIPLTEKQRVFVLNRDKSCKLCGRKPPEVVLEVDHIFPVSKGGGNEMENLQALCLPCNRAKSADILG
jgi:hypothetical protein